MFVDINISKVNKFSIQSDKNSDKIVLTKLRKGRFIMSFVLNVLLPLIIRLIIVLAAGFILSGVASKLITTTMSKADKFDVSLIRFLAKSAKIAIIVLTIIIAIGLLGIPTTGLIAGVSAIAAAIALALQGSLSNIAGGIFILMTRPFKTGDFIDIAGSAGTVKDIQLIHTVLLTVDNKEIIMPNGVVVNSTVVNYSNSEKRRVDLVFSIGYNDDARLAEDIIFRTAMAHTYTLTDPAEPFVRESAHTASSIEITARVWCKAEDYWTLHFDLIENVREEFAKNGISIPYNQLDVNIHNN